MIVIIDNYDSFVFNIARYFQKLGEVTDVVRNDVVSLSDIASLRPRAVVISPGPCTPNEAGISTDVVRDLSGRTASASGISVSGVFSADAWRVRVVLCTVDPRA